MNERKDANTKRSNTLKIQEIKETMGSKIANSMNNRLNDEVNWRKF
jgi:hypothetical protein